MLMNSQVRSQNRLIFSTLFKSLIQLGPEPLVMNALYKIGLWTGHYKRSTRPDFSQKDKGSDQFTRLFTFPDRAELLRVLDQKGTARLLVLADEITTGKIQIFGGETVSLQLTFNEPLHHWTDYETGKSPLPQSKFIDIKYLWEPARFGWGFVLGHAFQASGDDKYAEAFWKYFEQFIEGNPPYLGPHWMNGQEVAIRLMAFAWCAQVFEGSSVTTSIRHDKLNLFYWSACGAYSINSCLCQGPE